VVNIFLLKELEMVKHIVMWKLKDQAEGASKEENTRKLKDTLEAMKAKIPQIVDLEVGLQMRPDESAYDVVLTTSHQTREDLEKYQSHPHHQQVAAFVKKIVSDRKVVDYEN
jgi:hypothetical protein